MPNPTELNVHIVPGGTVGLGAQPTANPMDIFKQKVAATSIWTENFGRVAFAAATITNAADVASGRVGFRAAYTGTIAGDQIAGIGIYEFNAGAMGSDTRNILMAAVMSGAVTDPLVCEKAGYWFLETDAVLQAVNITEPTRDFAFIMAPSWISGPSLGPTFLGLAGTQGFGICWAARLNDNYHLFMARATIIADYAFYDLIDTGISARDNVIKVLRVEWGWDNILLRPMVRAVIDGVTVAEMEGPFTFITQSELAIFGNGCFVGVDKCDSTIGVGNDLDVFFGTAMGIVMGEFDLEPDVIPPEPPIVINECTVLAPVFVDDSNGIIEAFIPCSLSGQQGDTC